MELSIIWLSWFSKCLDFDYQIFIFGITLIFILFEIFKKPEIYDNPRPAGGAYSAPLSNIRDNLRTTLDIATKLSVPYRTSIWHLVWNFCYFLKFILGKWRFIDIMLCDFELKMVVIYIDRTLMHAEAKRKQKVSKQRKLNYLQDSYLGFSKKFGFWPPKFQKKFFWEKCSNIQNFQNFQKNVLYVWKTHESS